MKKLFFVFLVAAFASCGNSGAETNADSASVETDTSVSGTLDTDTTGVGGMGMDTTGMGGAR